MPFIPSSPFSIRMVAHHQISDLPGGPFVMGSSFFEDATPHWVHLSPFGLGTRPVTEGQFRKVMGRPGEKNAPEERAATCIDWFAARRYLLTINANEKVRLGFPTEAEWEYGVRGPAVDLRELMQEEGIVADDFPDWACDRFENFVERIEMGARILTDPTDHKLRKILGTRNPLYAWRVYGTPSGALTGKDKESWSIKTEMRSELKAVSWGPENEFGLQHLAGSVQEWVGDWYRVGFYRNSPDRDPMGPKSGDSRCVRGGSMESENPDELRAAYRGLSFYSRPLHEDGGLMDGDVGFRVATTAPENS